MTHPVIDTSLVYTQVKRFQLRSYRSTRAKIERLMEKNPQQKNEYYFELARLEARRKNWSQAQRAVESGLEIEPGHAEASLFLAQVLEIQKDYEQAQTTYRSIIDAHPDLGIAYREYGRFLLTQTESLLEIQSILLKGLALNPQDALAHLLLAKAFLLQDRTNHALLHLDIALRFHNGSSPLYQQFAHLFMTLGKYEEAAKQWQLAVKMEPRNKNLRHQMKRAVREIEKHQNQKSV